MTDLFYFSFSSVLVEHSKVKYEEDRGDTKNHHKIIETIKDVNVKVRNFFIDMAPIERLSSKNS